MEIKRQYNTKQKPSVIKGVKMLASILDKTESAVVEEAINLFGNVIMAKIKKGEIKRGKVR